MPTVDEEAETVTASDAAPVQTAVLDRIAPLGIAPRLIVVPGLTVRRELSVPTVPNGHRALREQHAPTALTGSSGRLARTDPSVSRPAGPTATLSLTHSVRNSG